VPFNQPLSGLVEPDVPSWEDATTADKLAFYQEAGKRAVLAKRAELARAIGANGRRMKPRKYPRPDGANGPVMTPHDEDSRTRRLLAARAWGGGLTLFWHAGSRRKDQKRPWGTILGFHAAGAGRLPKRDVRLSKRGINQVRADMRRWWINRVAAATKRKNAAERKEQSRLVAKYRSLKAYFRPPGEGFKNR
jgi:hypothetical protein